MGVVELFSKRQQLLKGEVSDIYIYDCISVKLKFQIKYIIEDIFGNSNDYFYKTESREVYKYIVETLCREYGLPYLDNPNHNDRSYYNELFSYFFNNIDAEKCIDIIEFSFKLINRKEATNLFKKSHEKLVNAIEELNTRFKENGVGYQFIVNEIIRIDSEFIHQEAVKPALKLLHLSGFEGAKDEFLLAFEHYRKGNNKEAINECLKAFESTMKTICIENTWVFPPNATSNALIKICLDKHLIPVFWEQNLTSLRSLMESTISTGRNKLAAHGQGKEIVEVPNHLVAYILHMTASTIVFLIEANNHK